MSTILILTKAQAKEGGAATRVLKASNQDLPTAIIENLPASADTLALAEMAEKSPQRARSIISNALEEARSPRRKGDRWGQRVSSPAA